MTTPPDALLEPGSLARAARSIGSSATTPPPVALPVGHDTVTLTAADADGRMVSFIQSNYMGFGSGIVIPGTGIAMQNRGNGFQPRAGTPEPGRGRQAALSHDHSRLRHRERRAADEFRLHGRTHAAPGARTDRAPGLRSRREPAGRFRRTPLAGPAGLHRGGRGRLLRGGRECPACARTPRRHGGLGAVRGCAQLILRVADGYCAASDHRKEGMAAGY